MYSKTKKVISLALLGATTSLMAMYGEHAYLYKDPRIMGMGGANVAVGGYSTAVFSNPAGLANIKKEHGIVVDILGLGVNGSGEMANFANDMTDASDSEDDAEMIKVVQDYAGQNFHMGFDNYSSISKNSDAFAWSIGLLAAADINLVTHANGSVHGGFVETSSRAYGGVVVGVAKPYATEIGRVDIGFGIKYISQISAEGALSISELTSGDDVATQMEDKYRKDSSGVGFDMGAIYRPFEDSVWHPSIGLSILNIGSLDMDYAYGGQPMTVNIGAAIQPDVKYIDKLVLAVDYVDLLNANEVRMYKFNGTNNEVLYEDLSESDYMKRLRIGTSIGLVDTRFFSTTLNLGLYQGAYTAGLDLDLLILKLNVATYEEQLGSGSVDMPDRRYMVKLGIGW